MIIQPYQPEDRAACLAVFASNVPRFFTGEEAEAFRSFLDALPGPYFVARQSGDGESGGGAKAPGGPPDLGAVVASGGFAREEDGRWSLCWIQVHSDRHGQGVGLELVRGLEARIRYRGGPATVRLETISRTDGFFTRLGYGTVGRTVDGWAPGVDEVEMVRRLTPLHAGTTTPADQADRRPGLWEPGVVAELNGQEVKVARIQGTFDWHHHPHGDELFWVLRGGMTLEYRDRRVTLEPGDLHVVPAGVEHRPVAAEETHILMMEPAGTLNTGNRRTPRTVDAPERIPASPLSPPDPGGPA